MSCGSATLAMSASVLNDLPGKLDINRNSNSVLCVREKVGKGGISDNDGTLVKSA